MSDAFDGARQHFVDGLGCFEAGRWAAAETEFRASLALLPGRASTLANLGATLVRLGRPQEAMQWLDQALQAQPGDLHACAQRGQALLDLRRDDEALACFERVLAAVPADAAAGFHRTLALNRLGRHDLALQAVEALLTQRPVRAATWLEHARTLQGLARLDEALVSYAKAQQADPAAPAAFSERGALLKDMGRLAEAAASFEQALARGADDALTRYLLAAVSDAPAPPSPPENYVETLFDGYADQFESHLLETLHYRAHQVLIGHLASLCSGRFGDALDLGCGTGLCGPLARPLCERLTGIDLSRRMLALARQTGAYDDLVHAELTAHLSSTESRHDLVLATDTFIYVGDLEPVFAGVRRVLLPGGLFCFSAELAEGAQPFELQPSSRYAHSEAALRTLAARHGFDWVHDLHQPLRDEQRQPVAGLYVYLRAGAAG
ncbi:MAG: methyltransferase domain-containing protein [Rubrivivax sp.]|nr:methyltransferase domain-containing protein [Rubrivivax sp.]